MAKEINTMADFAGLGVGQIVIMNSRKGLFLGHLLVATCGCCTENYCRFPYVARTNAGGNIELVEIRILEEPHPQEITGVSIIHTVDESNPEYQTLKDLLIAAGMI